MAVNTFFKRLANEEQETFGSIDVTILISYSPCAPLLRPRVFCRGGKGQHHAPPTVGINNDDEQGSDESGHESDREVTSSSTGLSYELEVSIQGTEGSSVSHPLVLLNAAQMGDQDSRSRGT